MKRAFSAATMAIVLLPGMGVAQSFLPDLGGSATGPRIRVTPFIGQAPSVSRLERWTFTSQGATTSTDIDVKLGSGAAAGLALEVRAVDRLAIIGSAALISRGPTTEHSMSDGQLVTHVGSDFLLAKGALALRLREEVSELQVHSVTATLFAGPAFIREMPKADPSLDAPLLDPLTHWAVNFGANAEIPLGWNSLAIQAGVEDYYTLWNKTEFARRYDVIYQANGFSVDADPSHMWLFRAGLSLRLR